MIKLIGSDMDGTFLGLNLKMPDGAFEVIDKLIENDILFVAASGRSYTSIAKLFPQYENKIAIVAENGAIVEYKGEELSLDILPQNILPELIAFLDRDNTHPIINTKQVSYTFPRLEPHFKVINYYTSSIQPIKDISEMKSEAVALSVYIDDSKVDDVYKKVSEKYGDILSVVITGHCWLDISPRGINKGEAIRALMFKLGISKEEVMAFGDYDNDIEMLEMAEESYAMPHATENVKKVAKYICKPEEILKIMESTLPRR